MKAPESSSLDALEAALDERQSERRAGGDDLDELLLVLSLAPQWTDELIRRVVGEITSFGESMLQLGRTGVGARIRELDRRGWLQRAAGVRIEGEDELPAVVHVDPHVVERQISRRLEEKDGRAAIERRISELGSAMTKIVRSGRADSAELLAGTLPDYLPRITARWAWLAAAAERRGGLLTGAIGPRRVSSWQPVVERFEQRIEASSTHEALRWIEAAQPLAALLARTLETSLDLAVRRASLALELRDRRRHDLMHLESFLERGDQIEALVRLIDGSGAKDEPWALHLLGSGGVGKTMLLRHLTAQMAEDRSLTVGRVDFDFLNPDYPRLAPGLLLWAFAQELRVFDSSGQVSAVFEDSERVLRQLHEELQGAGTAERATDHALFGDGLELYAQALDLLPAPVVLVIDTCEELTKPRAGVDAHFNVEETFRILERLQARVASLRVVFAGRRPLARAGAGWRCETCDLPARPFLRLFEMRGFTVDEAERYLEAGGVPAELIEPVVHRSSPDPGGAAQIEWQSGGGPADVVRCNPYELRFFAEWARDEPPPSAEDIESAGGERYVELRILRRLGDRQVAELLPIFGLARHLDAELIGVLTGTDGEALEDFLHQLQQQEWIERRAAASAGEVRWIFSVEEGLRLRLASYFSQRPGRLEAQRRAAAGVLGKRLLDGDPAQLDFADLDAALRVMADEPDADVWWQDVEARLFSLRDRHWVGQQAGLLTGPEGVAGLPDEASWPELRIVHRLRPAVLATLALAEGDEPGGGLAPWMEVAETAKTLPHVGAELELRAKAMELTARLAIGQEPSPEEAREVWRLAGRLRGLPSAETAASLVAALEATVERFEEAPEQVGAVDRLRLAPEDLPADRRGDIDADLATAWMLHVYQVWRGVGGSRHWLGNARLSGLEAMLHALDGRLVAALGLRRERAVASFERAVDLAADDSRAQWLSWRRPEWLGARVRLEAVRALYPAVLAPVQTFRRFSPAAAATGVELDRLLAAFAELGLAEGPRSEPFETTTTVAETGPVDQPMLCHSHREVPPLALQWARMDATSGEIERAFRKWSEIARDAASHDVTVVRHAARAELRWAVRLRHFDGEPGAALADSSREGDQELIALAAVISGREFDKKPLAVRDALRTAHASWQRSKARDESAREEAMTLAIHRLEQMGTGALHAADMHAVLDGLEAALLAGQSRLAGDLALFVEKLDLREIADPESAWRLHLRRLVLVRWHRDSDLGHRLAVHAALDRERIDRLGLRRAGLVAWQEADVLALRRPTAASLLFAVARRLLADAADTTGAAICLTAQCCCLVREHPAAVESAFEDLRAAWRRADVPLERQAARETLAEASRRVPRPLWTWWLRATLLPWFLSDEPAVRSQVRLAGRQWFRGAVEPLVSWIEDPVEAPDRPGAEAEPGPAERPGGGGRKAPSTAIPGPPPGPPDESSGPPQIAAAGRGGRLAMALALLTGVALAAAMVGGLYVVLDRLLGASAPVLALLTFFMLGLSACIGGGAIWIRTLLRRGRRLEVTPELETGDGELDRLHFSFTRWDRRFAWQWPPWVDEPSASRSLSTELTMQRHDEQSYRERAIRIREHLSDLVDPAVEEVDLLLMGGYETAWEGELAEFFGGGSGTRFRRAALVPGRTMMKLGPERLSLPSFRAEPSRELAQWPHEEAADERARAVLVATRSALGRDAAIRGYSSLAPFGVELRLFEGLQLEQIVRDRPDDQRPERVVHFIGSVIASKAGLRFRLGDSGSGRSVDVRPQDIRQRFPSAWWVILQESPVSELPARSRADRRQADWLRAFAGELQAAGVPAVLTVPRLDAKVAAACIERCAKALRPRRSLLHLLLGDRAAQLDLTLLDTVAAVRRRIRRAESMDEEAAWDVVLYAPVGWRHPFTAPAKFSESA